MESAYLTQPGAIEIREVDRPQPGPGEILLRIDFALTSGTDLKAFRRGHPLIPMPGPFGHRYVGHVECVGRGVRTFEVGTPVWGVHSAPCGQCRPCVRGRPNLCVQLRENLVVGAFAQFFRLPSAVVAQNLLVRPSSVEPLDAALLEPVSCVVHALERLDWRGVDRVLIIGLGSMGLLFCRLLSLYTSAEVFALGRRQTRRDRAAAFGAQVFADTEVLASDRSAGSFDCVIECTGAESGWTLAAAAASPGGQVLFFGGLPRGTSLAFDTHRLHYEELRFDGCFHFGPQDVRRAADLIEGEEVRATQFVDGSFALRDLVKALEKMAQGDGIQYAIDPWRSEDRS